MKRKLMLVAALLLILLLALGSGSLLLVRVFSLCLILLLAGYLWAFYGVRGLEAHINKLPAHYQAGDWIDEEITLTSRSRLPKLLLEVKENTALADHPAVFGFNLAAHGTRTWRSSVYCRRRGRYQLGSFTASATDPLGLFSRSCRVGEPQEVIVYPATVELPGFRILSPSDPVYSPGRWLTSENTPDASRVREYASGDSLNRIHWQSTAHNDKLMVKVFDPERSSKTVKNIWLVLDMEQQVQRGGDTESTAEYGVTIAASLAKKLIGSRRKVGLALQAEQLYSFIPDSGGSYLSRILEALALVEASGATPVGQLISQQADSLETGSVMIVITPNVAERTVAALRHAVHKGINPVLIFVDPASFDGSRATSILPNLVSYGIQVYTVRQGVKLTEALDDTVLRR